MDSMQEDDTLLRKIFFDILKHHHPDVANKVDIIFALSQAWTNSAQRDTKAKELGMLENYLSELEPEEMILVSSAFSQLLNLHNIAEEVHNTRVARRTKDEVEHSTRTTNESMNRLIKQHGLKPEQIYEALCSQTVDLVMTAHPTQALRRSVLKHYNQIAKELEFLHSVRASPFERKECLDRIHCHVQSAWRTDEIRRSKPTPQDEMKNGLSYFEQTIFHALPKFLRRLDSQLTNIGCPRLPLSHTLFKFGSWMGGDRDGNPNVTPTVTRDVVLLARLSAVNIYFKEVGTMMFDLSMWRASDAMMDEVHNIKAEEAKGKCLLSEERKASAYTEFWGSIPETEPYRVLFGNIRDRLYHTREVLQRCIANPSENIRKSLESPDCISCAEDLLKPLKLMYDSLHETGDGHIADNEILDFIRQVQAFGMCLTELDIRQESTRHSEVMSRITEYLDIGKYMEWSEEERLKFLNHELVSKRPLVPPGIYFSEDELAVVNAFRMLATLPADSMGAYVISMAQTASDVLCVKLLMREFGLTHFNMRVAPLFETLDDLDNACDAMRSLYENKYYMDTIQGHQECMIGYSDSGKDAGRLAAAWALFKSQEDLVTLAKEYNVTLTLFHGRGGTVGRGGAPAHLAVLSQPKGTIHGSFRVTVQGEIIEQQFGEKEITFRTLDLYTSAVLEHGLMPQEAPKDEWRALMETMSKTSCDAYRGVVFGDPNFIKFFRSCTPVGELGRLNIGSRPDRRKADPGVGSLRAIPWIFAWTQVRFNLPVWLGIGEALEGAISAGGLPLLQEMCQQWPFFKVLLDLIAMVFGKADPAVFDMYAKRLGTPEDQPMAAKLQELFKSTSSSISTVLGGRESGPRITSQTADQGLQTKLLMRAPYVTPLNVLQVQTLYFLRLMSKNANGEELSPEETKEFARMKELSSPNLEELMPDVQRPASPAGSVAGSVSGTASKNLLQLNPNHADLLAVAIEDTMIIGMKGIAAGMQNTG